MHYKIYMHFPAMWMLVRPRSWGISPPVPVDGCGYVGIFMEELQLVSTAGGSEGDTEAVLKY